MAVDIVLFSWVVFLNGTVHSPVAIGFPLMVAGGGTVVPRAAGVVRRGAGVGVVRGVVDGRAAAQPECTRT